MAKPKSKAPIIAGVVVVVVLLLAVLFMAGMFGGDGNDSDSKTVNKTFLEFTGDDRKLEIGAASAGDTVVIADTISEIDYSNWDNITEMDFESVAGTIYEGTLLSFEGNLTSIYSVGDDVRITLTVIDTDDEGEMFDEMWDEVNDQDKPLPASTIEMDTPIQQQGTKTMTMLELMETIKIGWSYLSKGDTVVISDTISTIDYYSWGGENVTYIIFESTEGTDYDWDGLEFAGDLTDTFTEGDDVRITLTIIEVASDGITMEYYAEGWDSVSEKTVPISPSAIMLA